MPTNTHRIITYTYIYTYIHIHSRKQDPAPKAYRLVATETTETQRQKKTCLYAYKNTHRISRNHIYIVGNETQAPRPI